MRLYKVYKHYKERREGPLNERFAHQTLQHVHLTVLFSLTREQCGELRG